MSNTHSPRLCFHCSVDRCCRGYQVFSGLPLLLVLVIVILVMEFVYEEELATCPNHLKQLVRRAAVTSCTPNIAQSVSAGTSSSSPTQQIQRTIGLSFLQSCCKSGAVGAQVSLPCNADCTQALKTFPRVLRDTCFNQFSFDTTALLVHPILHFKHLNTTPADSTWECTRVTKKV